MNRAMVGVVASLLAGCASTSPAVASVLTKVATHRWACIDNVATHTQVTGAITTDGTTSIEGSLTWRLLIGRRQCCRLGLRLC